MDNELYHISGKDKVLMYGLFVQLKSTIHIHWSHLDDRHFATTLTNNTS